MYKHFTGKGKVCFISQVIFRSLQLASWPGEMFFRQCRTFIIQKDFPSRHNHGGMAWEGNEGGIAKGCLKRRKWELRRNGQEWMERSEWLENSQFNKNVARFKFLANTLTNYENENKTGARKMVYLLLIKKT